ncbi:MAG: hypothetical protein JNG88_02405 [Phycisphaerales bacterium]|nr:hypothetical protein [Phycisphaerales bacterium]
MSESDDTTRPTAAKPPAAPASGEPGTAPAIVEPRGSHEVVAYVSDLIFATKITATARFVGVRAVALTSCDAALRAAGEAVALVVDMHTPGETADELIRSVRQMDASRPIVAFYSHVCTELAERASAAGASEAMPRSKFSRELGAILQRLAAM